MPSKNIFVFCVAICGSLIGSFLDAAQPNGLPNVLFIAIDDLRPQLGCYGKEFMHSPNMDRLARRGVLFERAYCMVPTCGASRASLMTSIRPSPDRFVNYLAWAEKDAADALPLHSHFKNQGYTTISLGKVFHHKSDHADGWSEPAWRSSKPMYQNTEEQQAAIEESKKRWPQKRRHRALPYESAEVDDAEYPDGDCATKALEHLRAFAKTPDQPFFLAVGFLKPHLPFNAPKRYWDLYDADQINLPDNYFPPEGAPDEAVHNSGELRAYAGIHPSKPVDRQMARRLIHGYYACVSFTDAQIGRLLDGLDSLGLAENTIIVLWGDHGWQLGEHGMWNKHSCFETSMHAPLIVAPAKNRQDGIDPGTRVPSLVEFIDIYPSLCDLAGIDTPGHVQGSSFVPSMRDPSLPGKSFAVGRFRNGDTIRSEHMRFSEYRNGEGNVTGKMLYDHRSDPDENSNIVSGRPEVARELSAELSERKGR